jgi:hypothetical protein
LASADLTTFEWSTTSTRRGVSIVSSLFALRRSVGLSQAWIIALSSG